MTERDVIMNEWIDREYKVPDGDRPVLTAVVNEYNSMKAMCVDTYSESRGYFTIEYRDYRYRVVAWMELPDFPNDMLDVMEVYNDGTT